jgi:coatomer subunit epsilon
LTLPDPNSPDYTPTLLYQARAHIALSDPKSALRLIPTDSDNVAVKAAASLAKYVAASEASEKEAFLEQLRDLSMEIEEEDAGANDRDKALVRVLAGTAFTRAGELEEALETLGVDTEDLEA